MLPIRGASVHHTAMGISYLKEAGVITISRPHVVTMGVGDFLQGFDDALGFRDYIFDDSHDMGMGESLCKVAGQTCYMSFGPGRTTNADSKRYFENIIRSGHGSVLEHANFSFLIYGVSRSLTHELVRHRAGMAYSQVSQRYVDGSRLRFVERPEFQASADLHHQFKRRINDAATQYNNTAVALLAEKKDELAGMSGTQARKIVNQAARAMLPNETEAPIVATGNVRAWRHILEMRGSAHAEPEIRNLSFKLHALLSEMEPVLFMDLVHDGDQIVRRPL